MALGIMDEVDAFIDAETEEPPKPKTAADILAEVDAAIDTPLETVEPEPPSAVPSSTPAPVPQQAPAPAESLPSPVPTPPPQDVDEVQELPKPVPTRVPPPPEKQLEEAPEDPVDLFLSLTAGVPATNFGGEEIDFLATLDDKELSRVATAREDVPLTAEQERRVFEYQRATSPWRVPKTSEDWYNLTEAVVDFPANAAKVFGETLAGVAKGTGKAVYRLQDAAFSASDYEVARRAFQKLPKETQDRLNKVRGAVPGGFQNTKNIPDSEWLKMVLAELPESEAKAIQEEQSEKLERAREVPYSFFDPAIGLPVSTAQLALKVQQTGVSSWDKLAETVGLQSEDTTFERWRNRRQFDGAMYQYNMERPTSYHKFLDVIAPAITSVAKSNLPSVEDYMREHGITREQAISMRDYEAEELAFESITEVEKTIPELDEDIVTAGDILTPEGFGLDTVGLAMNMGRVAAGISPRLWLKMRFAGLTPDQRNALLKSMKEKQDIKAKKKFDATQKPTVVGKVGGAIDERIKGAIAWSETSPFWNTVRKAAPYVSGAGIGYAIDSDNPLSVLYGAIMGRVALSVPEFMKLYDEARILSAGGRKGTFATLADLRREQRKSAREKGAQPEIILKGGVADKISGNTGKLLDDVLDNIGEYARSGVQPTLAALAVGIADSSDAEELSTMMGQTLLWGAFGRARQQLKRQFFGGVDPVYQARVRRQDAADLQKTLADLTPESRAAVGRITDWQNVIDYYQDLSNRRALQLQEAKQSNDPTRIAEAEKAAVDALNAVDRMKNASVQTRNEYGRLFLTQLARNNLLVNTTLRRGQNNVGIHFLTEAQIFEHYAKTSTGDNGNDPFIVSRNATPEQAKAELDAWKQRNPNTTALLEGHASQSGFYSPTSGTNVYRPGVSPVLESSNLTFDKSKPSVVINADSVLATARAGGNLPITALNHEIGHYLKNIPEYAELIKDAEALLFKQQVRDATGKVVAVTDGLYSNDDLVNLFVNYYLRNTNSTDEFVEFAKMAKLWNEQTDSLDRDATAEYMRNEITADLNSEIVSRFLGKDPDPIVKRIYDTAMTKLKVKKAGESVETIVDAVRNAQAMGEVSGAFFTPEVLRLGREALKDFEALNGQFSQAADAPEGPKISKAQAVKNPALVRRYLINSPLVPKVFKAQVYGPDGQPVGDPVTLDDPSVSVGSWRKAGGNVEQVSGIGGLPSTFDAGAVPEGGRVVISMEAQMQPDGKTPVILKSREAKKQGALRGQLIAQALDTPDEGAPGRFNPTREGGETYRGTLTPLQVEALKNIPDSVLPAALKQTILTVNDALVRGDGTRFIVDYAAVMEDSGRYRAFSPELYDIVPIGMMLSKDGNFLFTGISVGRLFAKLNAWYERMPARLEPWQGSKTKFWQEFEQIYLDNWRKGLPGSGYKAQTNEVVGKPLDPNPQIADAKKNIFNDFLNLLSKDTEYLNPDRTKVPRRKGDPRGKDFDRTIMSLRVDHVAEIFKNPAGNLPISYGLAKQNYMPRQDQGGVMYRPKPAGTVAERGFYSRLQQVLDQKVQGRTATAEQVKAIIENPQNGVKADEIKWSGVLDEVSRIAEENQGKVPKEAILEYLQNEGDINFEESRYGEPFSGNEGVYDPRRFSQLYAAYYNSPQLVSSEIVNGKPVFVGSIDAEFGPGAYQDFLMMENIKEKSTEKSLRDQIQKADEMAAEREAYAQQFAKGSSSYNDYMGMAKRHTEQSKHLARRWEILSRGAQPTAYTQPALFPEVTLPAGEGYREVVMTAGAPVSRQAKSISDKYGIPYNESSIMALSEAGATEAEIALYSNGVDAVSFPRVGEFTRTHYPTDSGYIAHMRMSDRPDQRGKRGLFIEEFQSDRHQKGRSEGYAEDYNPREVLQEMSPTELRDLLVKVEKDRGRSEADAYFDLDLTLKDELVSMAENYLSEAEAKPSGRVKDIRDYIKEAAITGSYAGQVPDAPFKKDWGVQLFKRALRDAVDENKEWIGWTTGIEQVRRYENYMRQAVDAIDYEDNGDGTLTVNFESGGKNTGSIIVGKSNGVTRMTSSALKDFEGRPLKEIVGKSVADQILKSEKPEGILKGEDLSVGGEGMKGFYDQIMPKEVGKYVARMGGKVEKADIFLEGWERDRDGEWRQKDEEDAGTSVPIWMIRITPDMKKSVQSGQPQYMPRQFYRGDGSTQRAGRQLTEAEAIETLRGLFTPRSSVRIPETPETEPRPSAPPLSTLSIPPTASQALNNALATLQYMPQVAVVPERFTGAPESARRGRFAEPSPFLKSFEIDEFTRGGKFFDAVTKEDITDNVYQTASIDVAGARPAMIADVPAQAKGEGSTYKSNLFRKSAGWEWISETPPEVASIGNDSVLVSVEGSKKHVYALKADFEGGVQLQRYPDKKSEPRLRPTGKGELVLGNEVGRISIRGKEHPVYDSVRVVPPKGKALEDVAPVDTVEESALAGVQYKPKGREDRASLRVRMTRQALTDAALSQESWKDWYKEHQETLNDFFGDYAPLFQDILAVTSQAASVKANVGLALKAFGQMMRGEEFSGYLPAVIGNLNAIRNKAAVGGRKIGKYKSANEGDTAAVVVDRHIASLLFGTKSPTAAQFEKATRILTEIANDIGWEPSQVQAALWAYSIVKSGKTPQSYGSYLRQLEERGGILQRIGEFNRGTGGADGVGAGRGRYSPVGEAQGGGVRYAPRKLNLAEKNILRTMVPASKLAAAKNIPTKIPDEYRGKPFFTIMADLLGGGMIRGVNMQGGPIYPALNYKGDEITGVWASTRSGVQSILTDLIKTDSIWEDANGKKWALIAPFSMSQTAHQANMNFGRVFMEDIAAAVKSGQITKEAEAALLDNIRTKSGRKSLADFPSFTSKNLDAFYKNLSFEDRATVVGEMSTVESKNFGVPSPKRTLRHTRDPDYQGIGTGNILSMLLVDIGRLTTERDGKMVLRDDLSAKDIGVDEHISYDTVIPGRVVSFFKNPIPFDVAMPDPIAKLQEIVDAQKAIRMDEAEKQMAAAKTDKEVAEAKKKLAAAERYNIRPDYAYQGRLPAGVKAQVLTEGVIQNINETQDLNTSYAYAQAMSDALTDNWQVMSGKETKGLMDFVHAIDESDLAETLTRYDEKQLRKLVKEGRMSVYKLPKSEVYFGIKTDEGGDRELVGVMNNSGIGGMLNVIMAKALQEGANVLSAYAVPVPGLPNGKLPTLYGKHGWKVVETIDFDPEYPDLGATPEARKQKIAAMKAAWRDEGWSGQEMPKIVVMRHDGIRRTVQGTGKSRVVAEEVGVARAATGEVAGGVRSDEGRVDRRGTEQPLAGSGNVLARGLDTFVEELGRATPAQLRTIGITPAQRTRILESLTLGTTY